MGMTGLGSIFSTRVSATAVWVVGSLIATSAVAHTRNDSLGVAASATDLLQVTCFDNGSGAPQSIHVEIVDSSPGAAPQVGVQLQRGDSLVSASDTADADALPSPEIGLNGPTGLFTVLVTKTGSGAKTYSLSFHCTTGLDGSGSHAGTSLSVLQNQ
jgi:hypothetical protein